MRYQYGNYYNSISKKDICLVRGDLIGSRLFLGYCYDGIYSHIITMFICWDTVIMVRHQIGLVYAQTDYIRSQLTFMETILKQKSSSSRHT